MVFRRGDRTAQQSNAPRPHAHDRGVNVTNNHNGRNHSLSSEEKQSVGSSFRRTSPWRKRFGGREFRKSQNGKSSAVFHFYRVSPNDFITDPFWGL